MRAACGRSCCQALAKEGYVKRRDGVMKAEGAGVLRAVGEGSGPWGPRKGLRLHDFLLLLSQQVATNVTV